METADDTLILLNGKLKKAEAVVRAAGAELTQKRKAAAQALEQRIQSELRLSLIHILQMGVRVRIWATGSTTGPPAESE